MTTTAYAALDDITDEQWQIVLDNQGLIGFFLKRHHVPDEAWDEAWSDAQLGLARAVQKYDPAKGFKFSTYAQHWIRQSVSRGRGEREGLNWRAHHRRIEEGHLDPDTPYEAPLSLDYEYQVSSSNMWATSDLTDFIVDDDGADELDGVDDRDAARRVVAVLRDACVTDLDHAVLERLGEDESLASVARAQGTSTEAVRRRNARLLAIARHPATGLNPEPWTAEGACAGMGWRPFFPTRADVNRPADLDAVRAVCERCPVRDRCAAEMCTTHPGYRAGTSGRDRKTAASNVVLRVAS